VTVSADEPTATTPSIAAVPDQVVAETFHKELLETCIDMLLRYTYFHSSGLPKRFVGIVLLMHFTLHCSDLHNYPLLGITHF